MLSDREGDAATRRAREAVERQLGASGTAPRDEPPLPVFLEERGVFVTWRRFPRGQLRGCIGYPFPVLPLGVAIRQASVAAASNDPRFPPVDREELDRLTVEVSVLTVPEELPPGFREHGVVVGQHGLIVERSEQSGLLLPQVAHEEGWTAVQFLDGTCQKAGLPDDAWKDPTTRVLRFEADVFAEKSPGSAGIRREAPVSPRRERRAPRT